jgi:hypothetical protein
VLQAGRLNPCPCAICQNAKSSASASATFTISHRRSGRAARLISPLRPPAPRSDQPSSRSICARSSACLRIASGSREILCNRTDICYRQAGTRYDAQRPQRRASPRRRDRRSDQWSRKSRPGRLITTWARRRSELSSVGVASPGGTPAVTFPSPLKRASALCCDPRGTACGILLSRPC